MPEHSPAPTPNRAVYGFAFYTLFTVLFVVYLAWAYLPISLGFHSYLPDKYFAVFIPFLVLVFVFFFAFLFYPAINLSLTPNMYTVSSVVDPKQLRSRSYEFFEWSRQSKEESEDESQVCKEKDPIDCNLCGDEHKPVESPPIAPLRFLDLQEEQLIFKSPASSAPVKMN